MIEADFADGNGRFALQGLAQGFEVFRARPVDVHGVYAVGGTALRIGAADAADRAEVGPLNRGNDDEANAGIARPRDDGIAVGVEFCGVEMAVGVDQHA